VAGVDEAGRGPLAGPVTVAAVILGHDWKQSTFLNDSKKLSPKKRDFCFECICEEALAYSIVSVSNVEIDEINILKATLQGMSRALEQLTPAPDYVLVDGNQYPPTQTPGETLVKGDSRSCSIAAASILAKVTRDRLMLDYAKQYPQYGFEKHKGYPTAKHREAVAKYGLTPLHRHSFRLGK